MMGTIRLLKTLKAYHRRYPAKLQLYIKAVLLKMYRFKEKMKYTLKLILILSAAEGQ